MRDLTVTKIRFRNGRWEGHVESRAAGATAPDIKVLYLDRPVEGVSLSATDTVGIWERIVPIPQEAVADGIHSFVITGAGQDEALANFTLIGGDVASEDLSTEVDLLRAELDMLKRAFRRHCVETA